MEYLLCDKTDIVPIPGGTLSQWNQFLEEQMVSYPTAMSFVKSFRKILEVGRKTYGAPLSRQLVILFQKAFSGFNVDSPDFWIKPNPALKRLAEKLEKASTAKRAYLLLEEYISEKS